jgi:hypothetical protein
MRRIDPSLNSALVQASFMRGYEVRWDVAWSFGMPTAFEGAGPSSPSLSTDDDTIAVRPDFPADPGLGTPPEKDRWPVATAPG